MSKRIVSLLLLVVMALCLAPQAALARWYDPRTGGFTSVDPAFDFPNNLGNPYTYVGGNPIGALDPTGREFNLSGSLAASAITVEIAAMKLAPYAPTIGDVLIGFVSPDPTFSINPLGTTLNATKREVIEECLHRNILARGYECVAMQFRKNGPGIDAIYKKEGTSVIDGAQNVFRVEFKVTGSGRTAEALLGNPSYGTQTSKNWDIAGYERLKEASRRYGNLAFDQANALAKRINWTSLSVDELDHLIKNADDVQKRLIGGTVIDDSLDKGGTLVLQVKEFTQEYLRDMSGDVPKSSFLNETRFAIIPSKSNQ